MIRTHTDRLKIGAFNQRLRTDSPLLWDAFATHAIETYVHIKAGPSLYSLRGIVSRVRRWLESHGMPADTLRTVTRCEHLTAGAVIVTVAQVLPDYCPDMGSWFYGECERPE